MGATDIISPNAHLKQLENPSTESLGESVSFIKSGATKECSENENGKDYIASLNRSSRARLGNTVTIAATILAVAVALVTGWVLVPSGIRYQVAKMVAISPEINPQLYSAWISPPVPVYLKVHLFNITNPEEVRLGKFPNLTEVGPFVFLEAREKVDISHDETDDTVTYNDYISYHFQENLSGDAKLSQTITIINVPYVAAAIKIAADLPWPLNDLAQNLLASYKEPLFVQKTVDEALFTGWKVPFLERIEKDIGITLVPYNTFGYFVGQNATKQGPYVVSRGIKVKSSFGTILKFKNESSLNVWGDPTSNCNKLDGTDGTVFPPFVTKQTKLKIFNAELCRSIYLTYQSDVTFQGIQSYRFTAPAAILEDPREENSENSCFCRHLDHNPNRCLKQGALDLGPCREGAPVAMSTPHFLDGNGEYIRKSGLAPNRSQHETFMVIESLTGAVLKVSKKIQINLIMKPVKGLSLLRKLPDMLFPLVWADEQAELDVDTAAELSHVLHHIQMFQDVSRWIALGISLIATAFVVIKSMCIHIGNSKR